MEESDARQVEEAAELSMVTVYCFDQSRNESGAKVH